MVNDRNKMLKDDLAKAKTETKKSKIEKQIVHEQPKCAYTLNQVIEIQDETELSAAAREKKMIKYFKEYMIATYKVDD